MATEKIHVRIVRPTNAEELNQMAKEIHTIDNHKWWHDQNGTPLKRNKEELLALVVSELSEALEGDRKNLMDDKLRHRKMTEVELADAYIRAMDYAAGFGIKLLWYKGDNDAFSSNVGAAIFKLMKQATSIDPQCVAFTQSRNISKLVALLALYADTMKYDLFGAIEEKRAFNLVREDHTYEARAQANGKKY
jgi:hypothetical protein